MQTSMGVKSVTTTKRTTRKPKTSNQESKEPVSIERGAKAQALKEQGYLLNSTGLYSVKEGDKESKSLIGRFFVDVVTKRHVYTVPDVVSEAPKASGVVLVTRLASLNNKNHVQVVEVHRSDMLARQPKFLEQVQEVKLPHKRKLNDFIDVLETLGMVAPVEKRYNATGVIRIGGNYTFLHPSGGALTSQELDGQHKVQFPLQIASKLTSLKYGWLRPGSPEEQIEDYRTLLKILDIAPGSQGYGAVLLGTHGFAPLSQLCSTGGLWAIIHGLTGSMKSATSRLPLQGYTLDFYGRQETSTINLREGASTPYAIEQVLYYLAGMFAHLDDGLKGNKVPQKDIEKFYKSLSTIGGHATTKQGGKRGVWGQGDGGFGIEPYPRGSGIYTVETLPASEAHASDLARYVVVSLDGAECVDTSLLTQLQDKEASNSMNRATCSYIQWLLPRMDEVLQGIAAREDVYREQEVHSRTPTSYAKLETGIAALLQYGVSIGAHTEQEAARMLEETRASLVHVALKQKAIMGVDGQQATANDTVHVFYGLLHKALREKRLYASDSSYRAVNCFEPGGESNGTVYRPQPPIFLDDETQHVTNETPDSYGWRWNESQMCYEPGPGGQEAGVLKVDGARLQLWMYVRDFKGFIYEEIDKLAKADEVPLPGVNEMLSKLKERGKLASIESTHLHGRNSRQARVYVLDITPEEEESAPQDTNTNQGTEQNALPLSNDSTASLELDTGVIDDEEEVSPEEFYD